MRTVAVVATALLALVPAPNRAAAPAEVVSVTVTPSPVDTTTGFADLRIDVHLRDPDGRPAELTGDAVVHAVAMSGTGLRPGQIDWTRLVNPGDTTDGVWTGIVRVAPGNAGTYAIDEVLGEPQWRFDPFTVAGDRWPISTVRTPLRVVTGAEKWFPRARVRAGARVQLGLDRAQVTTAPGTPSDASGVWTSPVAVPLADRRATLGAYGGRGSRGWSLQGATCADLTVQLQASATYPAAPITAGRPLTVTGNVWPAPSILPAEGGPLLLQRETAAGWTTVTTAAPRATGRYTLTWQPPAPGTYTMRVRLPGGGSPLECREQSTGTTLAATTVRVR